MKNTSREPLGTVTVRINRHRPSGMSATTGSDTRWYNPGFSHNAPRTLFGGHAYAVEETGKPGDITDPAHLAAAIEGKAGGRRGHRSFRRILGHVDTSNHEFITIRYLINGVDPGYAEISR